jgi:lipopolysaccharide/colanic/teichoic acid biosynthesis glycosyltransferase
MEISNEWFENHIHYFDLADTKIKKGNMFYQIVKKFMDIVGAILGLFLTVALSPFIAMAIKIDSSGPVIFVQERVGKDLQSFKCYKFRTMHLNSSGQGKKPDIDDERVTRVGRFLRSTSLDELPQFFNILCGDMSLVGPRPIVQEETHHYGNDINLYTSVLPGLTGLWQVSGRYNLSYVERVRLDVYYVCNRSIWLDIMVLFKTFWVVLKREGAY